MALTRLQASIITISLVILLVLLAVWSSLRPRHANTALLNLALPDVEVPYLEYPQKVFSPEDKAGGVWVLNVWATWCTGCRAEHDMLSELAEQYELDIVGLNYKDAQPDALQWLEKLGNPYSEVIADSLGTITAPWKISVLPTTFIVDAKGIVKFSHVGPIDSQLANNDLLPLIDRLKVSSSG